MLFKTLLPDGLASDTEMSSGSPMERLPTSSMLKLIKSPMEGLLPTKRLFKWSNVCKFLWTCIWVK